MIFNFITWTCRPEMISIGEFHASAGMMLLGMLICVVWGIIDYKRSSKALKKWKAEGANPKNKPECWSGVMLAAIVGVVLLFLRSRNPDGMEIGPIVIRWYGVMFVIGFSVGYWMLRRMFRHEGAPEDWMPTLLIYVFLATVIGARLGHCFFYEWEYYLAHPEKIIAIWEGGLASHGGTLGIIIAVFIYSKVVTKRSALWTFDRLCIPVAFVACLIRLGNLFNSEIFGHATSLPWGFKFPLSSEWQAMYGPDLACHPTQLYEAGVYLALFGLLTWMYWKKNSQERPGLLLGIFFIGIFLSRLFIEFVKNPQVEFEKEMALNMGQWLSVPFIIAGVVLIYRSLKRPRLHLDFPDKFAETPTKKK